MAACYCSWPKHQIVNLWSTVNSASESVSRRSVICEAVVSTVHTIQGIHYLSITLYNQHLRLLLPCNPWVTHWVSTGFVFTRSQLRHCQGVRHCVTGEVTVTDRRALNEWISPWRHLIPLSDGRHLNWHPYICESASHVVKSLTDMKLTPLTRPTSVFCGSFGQEILIIFEIFLKRKRQAESCLGISWAITRF